MAFDPSTDKIAITVPKFTFKKGAANVLFENVTDLIFSEPYLVTIAIDSQGVSQRTLNFNFVEYPNTARGGTVEMIGDGHLVYGPNNPGEFVGVSILLMESNSESRELGEKIAAIVKSKATDLAITSVIAVNPSASAISKLMQELTVLVSEQLKQSRDTYLFRTEGVFFRGGAVPYSINRQFTRGNEFAELTINVIPLNEPNGQGPVPRTINLSR